MTKSANRIRPYKKFKGFFFEKLKDGPFDDDGKTNWPMLVSVFFFVLIIWWFFFHLWL